jgi:hypothetical protein
MLVAGVQPLDGDGVPVDAHDPRPQAVVLLSPQGVGQQGLVASSFARLDRPVLVMTGTADQGQTTDTAEGTAQSYEQKLDPFRLAPPGRATAVVIAGATHFTFAGPDPGPLATALSGGVPSPPGASDDVAVLSTAFWEGTLGASPSRDHPLEGFLTSSAATPVTVEQR